MAIDMSDPYWWMQQQAGGFAPQAQRPGPRVEPLTPGEEQGLLGKIGGAALGGIGYVGSTLEKTFGGRALRGGLGMLSGMDVAPSELISMLPFSDTLGITHEENRVSGRDLLRQARLADSEDTWGNFLGGLGVELATDPGMYLTFGGGALTPAGKLAQKAGVLPGTTAERVRGTLSGLMGSEKASAAINDVARNTGADLARLAGEPLGYSVGFRLPFGETLGGLGESGLSLASGAAQVVKGADAIARKAPLVGHAYGLASDLAQKGVEKAGLYANAYLDPSVMGATTREGQAAARQAWAEAKPILIEARAKAARYAEELKASGADPTGSLLRQVAEGALPPAELANVHPDVVRVAQAMRGDLDATLAQLKGLGINVNALQDLEVNYLPRQMSALAKPTKGYGRPRQPLSPTDPRVQGRQEILKGVVGGTEGINRLVVDPAVHSPYPLEAAAHIRRSYLGLTPEAEGRLHQLQHLGKEIDPALVAERDGLLAKFQQGDDLADWARGLDPQYRSPGVRYFGNHPLADYEGYYDRVSRLLGAGEATHDLLARHALDMGPHQHGAVRLADALRGAGLTDEAAATSLARVNALRAESGLEPLTEAGFRGLQVPEQAMKEAARYLRGFTSPQYVSDVGNAVDVLTNWTKAFQTAPWPGFNVRNLVSGLFNNWVKGAGEAEGGFFKQVADARRLIAGEVIPDAHLIPEFAGKGLTAEEATRELARRMYAHGVGGHMPHLSRDVAGANGQTLSLGPDLEGYLGRIPGNDPKTLAKGARQYVGAEPGQAVSWAPWDVQGVGANADLFPLVAGGRHAGDVVEGVNRGSLFLALKRMGYTDEAAAKEVLATHFDYTRAAKTDFESKVAGRVVPFWTYTRNNIPFVLEQLAQAPGGSAGTLARVAQDLRSPGFLPDYLGSGLAAPVGPEEEGVQRYLTRLDLPPEQAFEFLKGGPNWKQNTLMGLLSQTNPILKGPLEYATGKQFFTGRDLGDLYAMTGSATLDQVLANSPLSRVATTARTLSDPRKYATPEAAAAIPLNLLTGVRLSDVDVGRQRATAEREYVQEALRALPEVGKFETLYLKPGMEQYLSPQEWQLMRLNATLQRRAQEEGKRRKGG